MKQLSITKDKQKRLVFVVHKHAATRLHYDFRLQVGSKMPSWATAKGPTLDPKLRRLANQVNDHKLEYRNFEGIIPEGYGAGTVMIWDEGTYVPQLQIEKGVLQNIEDFESANKVMRSGLKKGEIKFELFGKKLKGSFALVKTPGFGKAAWLMIKHKDKHVKENFDANTLDFSARSKKSMKEISGV